MPLDLEALTLIADIEEALAIGTKFATLDGKPLTTARDIIDTLLRDGTINLQEPTPRLAQLCVNPAGMYRVKAKLVKLSICECGFSLLDDAIPLGKIYTAYPQSRRRGYEFGCGGCGRRHEDIEVLLVDHRCGIPGWLPWEIFELDEASTTEVLA